MAGFPQAIAGHGMPVESGVFTRIWKFIDKFSAQDKVRRDDLDAALDDLVSGINETKSFEDAEAARDAAQSAATTAADEAAASEASQATASQKATEAADSAEASAQSATGASSSATEASDSVEAAAEKVELAQRHAVDAETAATGSQEAAGLAESAQAMAEAARDAAAIGAQGVYPTIASGLAATSDGDTFILATSDGWTLYENQSGVEVDVSGTFPSLTTLRNEIDQGIQTAQVRQDRPGEILARYTSAKDGGLSGPAVIGTVATVTDYGSVLRIGPGTVVALRDRIWIDTSRPATVRAIFGVQANTCDPEGEPVYVGVEWLDKNYVSVGSSEFHGSIVWESDGWQDVSRLLGDDLTPPAGAVYFVPYVQVGGADGTWDVAQISVEQEPATVPNIPPDKLPNIPVSLLPDIPDDLLPDGIRGLAVDRTIYIQGNGDNANDGVSIDSAVATIERALELAWLAAEPVLIEWYPSFDVETEGHLDMPDDCMIVCKHRTVVIRPKPGFEQRNVFRMGSGCFIEGMLFEGWQLDSFTTPSEGFAVSFRPGAVIKRVPYAHKIAVRTRPTWGVVPPPLDAQNGNPLVPRGGGVVLADGAVCSQNSIFPNIMTWGATPVSHNGLGYCARRGGLVNAVNAISMWAHKHFLALEGGQCILSSCSTQFGDWAMHADGTRQIVVPEAPTTALTADQTLANNIDANKSLIVDDMWTGLVNEGYTTSWTQDDEDFTRRDADIFLNALVWALKGADPLPVQNFVKGLFDVMGDPVYDPAKESALLRSFELIEDSMETRFVAHPTTSSSVTLVKDTLQGPTKRTERSRITAIGHTWTGTRQGVALTKIPPANPAAPIRDSILETNDGVVIATGQDDFGAALLARSPQGTLEVDPVRGLTGELFERAVRQQALRTAIVSSFGDS